ncbi:TfoX/Sxy family protein [Wukongibacter sp. M2B1]|uniref:TfoX/Sxy family protein n=1 Tax=Wukongibacter sp. M2B1 TaxID=3088895 RepID=UPI003D79FFAC
MGQLSKLPNIGKALEEKLNNIDVLTKEELFTLGSKEAFKRIREVDKDVCFNTLCALEGAVQGIRWHNLSRETKDDLKKFFK